MATMKLIQEDLKALKENVKRIEKYLIVLLSEPTIKSTTVIPKDAKTIESIDNLIRIHNLNRTLVLEGKQKIPQSLRDFTLVAKVRQHLFFRRMDCNRPEKVLLKSQSDVQHIKLNNWNLANYFLADKIGKSVILYNVNLRAVKMEFLDQDGDWILDWKGKYEILKGVK